MTFFLAAALLLCAQAPAPPTPTPAGRPSPAVERLGEGRFRIGAIHVDTNKREVTIRGSLNDVQALEFLANSRGGMKAYESAMTLDTDAISFNIALVLIGLDRANAKVATGHFDPAEVRGDPVSLTVEFQSPSGPERGPVEKLLYDRSTNTAIEPSEWVYTGSTFYPDGRFAADAEGVLIGFAHTPSSVIESVKGIGLSRYGAIVINPRILKGTPIALRITALGKPAARQKK